MTIIQVENLNKKFQNAPEKLIEDNEEEYGDKIKHTAGFIKEKKDKCPILLIAGPSGSGKTTTAKRTACLLSEMGICSTAISLDNFYLPKDSPDVPYNEDGTPDLESPYRLDVELLKSTFSKMLKCEPVEIPRFDFSNQARIKGDIFTRKENEVVIIEGIHALNPIISEEISEHAIQMYISVRTRLELADHSLVHPSVIRLMRRLSRDYIYRGKDIEGIFNMFESVSNGEKKYITPFKKYAEIEIDTYIPYEVLVYKNMLMEKLSARENILGSNSNFQNILKVFKETDAIDNCSLIPGYSLLREFIGNGIFDY